MRILFFFINIFIFINSNAQIIFESKDANKYLRVINIKIYYLNENFIDKSDTLINFSYFIRLDELNIFPPIKVGQMLEFFEEGNIKNIGYWNYQNDTFSLDSGRIIVFINPSKDVWLQQSYSKFTLLNRPINENTYKVSEITNWNISFNKKGDINKLVLDNIKVNYFEDKILYELYNKNTLIQNWSILK